jgi:hypothetical protein
MYLTGATGTATFLVLLYGRPAPLLALLPLVGWSRWVLDQHTPAQALVGSILGGAAPVLVFWRIECCGTRPLCWPKSLSDSGKRHDKLHGQSPAPIC